MESPNAFERLIAYIPQNSKVLDVGANGLGGENTTQSLQQRFSDYMGVNIQKGDILHNIFKLDFYKINPKERFDLVALDLDIENNLLQDWSEKGLERVRSMLADGGFLINYIMCTDAYGTTEATHEAIRRHWREFWEMDRVDYEKIGEKLNSLKGWGLIASAQEERRPYILWTLLQRTSGN